MTELNTMLGAANTAYVVSSGETSRGLSITSGNRLTVLAGGTIEVTSIVNNGSAFLHGYASQTIIDSATMNVSGGATASETVVKNFGSMIVYGNGVVNNASVFDGGTIGNYGGIQTDIFVGERGKFIYNTGVVKNLQILTGGKANLWLTQSDDSVSGNILGKDFSLTNGVASGAIFSSGISMTMSGATAQTKLSACDITILKGGTFTAESGTSVNNVDIYGGLLMASGATISNITVYSTGNFSAYAGCRIYDADVYSGATTFKIFGKSVASGLTVHSGARISASNGSAHQMQLDGICIMQQNAYVESTNILQNGYLCVSSGAKASKTFVNGGSIFVASSGILTDVTFFKPTKMIVKSGAIFTGTFELVLSDVTPDEAIMVSTLLDQVNSPDYVVSELIYQAAGTYKLIGDAANFNKDISVKVGDVTLDSKLNLSAQVTFGGYTYELRLGDENVLELVVNIDYDAEVKSACTTFDDGKNGGLAAYWNDETVGSVGAIVYIGGDGGSATTLLLKNDGYNDDKLTVFGGANNADMSDTDIVIDFYNGSLAGIAGGACSIDYAVNNILLNIGGGKESATVAAVYGGGLGNVNGDINVNVKAGAHIQNGIFGGARIKLKNNGDKASIGGDINLKIDGGVVDGNIYGGCYVNGTEGIFAGCTVDGGINLNIANIKYDLQENSSIVCGGYVANSGQYIVKNGISFNISNSNLLGQCKAGSGVFVGAYAYNNSISKITGNISINVTQSTIESNLICGGWAQSGASSVITAAEDTPINVTISNSCVVNVFGGGAHSTKGGNTVINGDIFITVTDSKIGVQNGEFFSYGTIYGRGQCDNDVVNGDVTITLSGETEVGNIKAKYSGDSDGGTFLCFDNFTGIVVNSIDESINSITISGKSHGAISNAKDVQNWKFDLSEKNNAEACLMWDSGDFSNDTIELRLNTINQQQVWTLVDLNQEGNIGNNNAFDSTVFKLFINDQIYADNFSIGSTIQGGFFDGYKLDFEDNKLTLGVSQA